MSTAEIPLEHLRDLSITPSQSIKIELYGAGGTGARMLYGLAGLHQALRALGWAGFQVSVFDPDTVSETNIVRGPFYGSDLGQHKAFVLTHRVNLSFGTHWTSALKKTGAKTSDFVITCVDTRAARAEIAEHTARWCTYHLDLGNESRTGQVLLGRGGHQRSNLPDLRANYPDLFDATQDEPSQPSCSAFEALERQDALINDAVTTHALALLWNLLRHGRITHQGVFINLELGMVTPIGLTRAAELV